SHHWMIVDDQDILHEVAPSGRGCFWELTVPMATPEMMQVRKRTPIRPAPLFCSPMGASAHSIGRHRRRLAGSDAKSAVALALFRRFANGSGRIYLCVRSL